MSNQQPKNQKIDIQEEIPGKQSTLLRQMEDKYLANGLQGFALMSDIAVKSAKGSQVIDVDGNVFLDIIGGIGVNGLGHSHPVWVKAMQAQLEEVSVGSFTSKPRVELLQKISKVAHNGLHRLQLYSSGAEAVESALRLCKNYTGKYELASFSGGFHGKTQGALGLMGSTFKNTYAPFSSGNHILPYANCYRCPFNTTHPKCGLQCIDYARVQLKNNLTSGLAAIIIEPIQGTAGNVIPPDDFMKAVEELAREFQALLICDEMITGFGRTGKYWCAQHSNIKPDIILIGKQFGGGFPISGILTNDKINETKPWGLPSGSSSSYGGNPLAAAAANTTLGIIEDENLVENSKQIGRYFLEKLASFKEEFSFIGEIRGRGLMLAIELVKDKTNKIPLERKQTENLFKIFLHSGLLTMAYTSQFRIQPAMTIDKGTIDEVVKALRLGFNIFKKELNNH